MDHTTFEPFSFRKHFLFLCDLEKEVWDFADPKTKRSTVWLMTVAYALICLKKSTRTLVLRKKHELLGMILIKEPYKRPKLLTTLALSSLLFLVKVLLSLRGFKTKYSYHAFELKAQKLCLEKIDNPQEIDSYINLLMVSKKTQGQGLGKKLVLKALELIKAQGGKCTALFTDESCNFKFYDRLGFTRIFDQKLKAQWGPLEQDSDFIRFLMYEIQIFA